MNNYITGKIIKELREKEQLTQMDLAEKLGVTDKAISKWETGKGLPDITLIEPLSKALKVSVIELMNGEHIANHNKVGNMLKSNFSVCPICGNVIYTIGENVNTCCGISLPHIEAELENNKHMIDCKMIENEYYISINHNMTKDHYISFIAYTTNDRCEIVKLYPEQNAETRFFYRGKGIIYAYCNKDGLYKKYI